MEGQVRQRYPIGIQTFSEIIENDYIYIDKTDFVYKMTHGNPKYIFLTRPRRFGKSLFVTTLKAYFEGKKDLFKGLAIEKLEKEWKEYPVLHFDFSKGNHKEKEALERYISNIISRQQKRLGIKISKGDIDIRLSNLIEDIYLKTGKQVVVLIDEYDAPLLNVMHKENSEEVRDVMCNFFSPLKGSDSYLKFVFLTGITKFSQLNFFSALNSIENISMDEDYVSICGITEDEMQSFLKPGIESLAQKQGYSYAEAIEKLKSQYDGYHFSWPSPDIYNPYSLLCALNKKGIDNYWFETATPTFLIETLKRFDKSLIYFCNKFVRKGKFDAPIETTKEPTPLLYQTGYLTIKDYNSKDNKFLLDFPNEEVRDGLLNSLLDEYITPISDEDYVDTAKEIAGLIKDGKMEEALLRIKQFFMTISFTTQTQNEGHYQQELGMLLSLGGLSLRAEERTSNGQIDMMIFLKDVIYVIELKLGKSAGEAIKQIDEKEYAKTIAFKYPQSKVIKVGINFDNKTRTISDYIIEPLEEGN